MNTPVTFKMAKFLKERGFDVPCNSCYEHALTIKIDQESNEPSGPFGWKEGEMGKNNLLYKCNSIEDIKFICIYFKENYSLVERLELSAYIRHFNVHNVLYLGLIGEGLLNGISDLPTSYESLDCVVLRRMEKLKNIK